MTSYFESAVSDGVRNIILNRAPHNLLNDEFKVKLIEALGVANHDWDTRVIVLESGVPGIFSLGAEADPPRSLPRTEFEHFGVPSTQMALDRHFLRAIWDAKWPLIAKVGGTAANEGLLLAALADVAVVSETAEVGLPQAELSIVAGLSILRRCMTEQAARHLLWSGRLIKAARLRALGSGMLVVPPEELDVTVAALARDIARHDRHFLRHMKIAMTESEGDAPLSGYATEQRYTALLDGKAS
jgi:enoyl-CoA hydratase/carnithine racemase